MVAPPHLVGDHAWCRRGDALEQCGWRCLCAINRRNVRPRGSSATRARCMNRMVRSACKSPCGAVGTPQTDGRVGRRRKDQLSRRSSRHAATADQAAVTASSRRARSLIRRCYGRAGTPGVPAGTPGRAGTPGPPAGVQLFSSDSPAAVPATWPVIAGVTSGHRYSGRERGSRHRDSLHGRGVRPWARDSLATGRRLVGDGVSECGRGRGEAGHDERTSESSLLHFRPFA
ncbi:hypothetical protein LX90_009089 [Lentzea flava]|nr:hypothetical protein [Lentzea flava]